MDKPTINQWLASHMEEYKGRRRAWINVCESDLDVTRDAVTRQARKLWPPDQQREEKPMDTNDSDIVLADDFLAVVDVVDQIKRFLDDTLKDNYIETEKLRRRFDVSQSKWREIVNLKMFAANIFTFDCGGGKKKTVWSSAAGIDKLKATTSLSRYDV